MQQSLLRAAGKECWAKTLREDPRWSRTPCLPECGPGGCRCAKVTPRRPCARDKTAKSLRWWCDASRLFFLCHLLLPWCLLVFVSQFVFPPSPSAVSSPVPQQKLRGGSLWTCAAEIRTPDCPYANLRSPTPSVDMLGLSLILSLPRFPCV